MPVEKRVWTWHSPSVDRPMSVACWGHHGEPVVLFPTAGGDFEECERFLMIKVLSPLIEAGRIKVYGIGTISQDAWLDPEARPWHKSWLQARFDEYLVRELLPHVANDCGGYRPFIAAGASLGAYNAVTAAARHPGWFRLAIGMSGTYDFDRWMGGHRDDDYYFHQPLYFLPNLGEGPVLDALRRVHFVIASGRGRYEAPWESERLAAILKAKGVPTSLELWGADVHHDWPTWRSMLPLFLDKLARIG